MLALRRVEEPDFEKVRVPMDAAAAAAWDGEGGGAALARALVRAVRQASEAVDERALEEAVRSGSPRRALGLFPLADVSREVVSPAGREALFRGYGIGISHADRLGRLVEKARTPIFAVRDERAIMRLLAEGTALSQRYLSLHAERALEVLIRSSALRGTDPRRLARLIVKGNLIGLDERRVQAVVRYLHAQIAAGVRPDVAHKRTEAYSRRLLLQRAEVLARTEVQRVLHVGAMDGWLDLARRGLIPPTTLVVWHVRPLACKNCDWLDGKVVPLGGTFPNGLRYPPVHPNCRCVLELRVVAPPKTRRRRPTVRKPPPRTRRPRR